MCRRYVRRSRSGQTTGNFTFSAFGCRSECLCSALSPVAILALLILTRLQSFITQSLCSLLGSSWFVPTSSGGTSVGTSTTLSTTTASSSSLAASTVSTLPWLVTVFFWHSSSLLSSVRLITYLFFFILGQEWVSIVWSSSRVGASGWSCSFGALTISTSSSSTTSLRLITTSWSLTCCGTTRSSWSLFGILSCCAYSFLLSWSFSCTLSTSSSAAILLAAFVFWACFWVDFALWNWLLITSN